MIAIQASRASSWTGIDKRTHTVHGVYSSTQDRHQFVVLGSLEFYLSGSLNATTLRFCSKLDVQSTTSGRVEIVRYEAFAVCLTQLNRRI